MSSTIEFLPNNGSVQTQSRSERIEREKSREKNSSAEMYTATWPHSLSEKFTRNQS